MTLGACNSASTAGTEAGVPGTVWNAVVHAGISWTADGTSASRRQPPEVQLDAGRVQFRFQAGTEAGVPGDRLERRRWARVSGLLHIALNYKIKLKAITFPDRIARKSF